MSIDETRRGCAKALKADGIVRTWMDEMALRLRRPGGLDTILVAMARDQGSLFVNPTIQTKYPCEFCGTRDYLDCYHLCLECCLILTLPFQVGEVVAERFTSLMEKVEQGQVGNLESTRRALGNVTGQRSGLQFRRYILRSPHVP